MNIKNTLADTVMEYICRILLIGTSKLILISVFTLLIVFTTLVKPIPLWFAGIYLAILIADMAFWLIRIFMEQK